MPGYSEQECNELRDQMKELEAANSRLFNEYMDLMDQERELSNQLVSEQVATQSALQKLHWQQRHVAGITQELRYCLENRPPGTCNEIQERLETAEEVEDQFYEEAREHLDAVSNLQAMRCQIEEEMKQNQTERQTNRDQIGDIRETMNGGHCGCWEDGGGDTGYPNWGSMPAM
ncbi:MAG: hypothetical protein Fur0021_04490 [Candidatus Promineifilaceae bacterium]